MMTFCNQIEINKAVNTIKRELHQNERPIPAILKDRFSGVPALVVSAGPSAKHWRGVFEKISEPVLVVCVKQAIELQGLNEVSHLHFCNTWNLRNYKYDRSRVLRFFSSADGDPPSYQQWDVNFRIARGKGDLQSSLAAKQNFEEWKISQSGMNRPWGPGILYETVVYTLLHMGVSSIRTVGWDIADADGSNTHFYDDQSKSNLQFRKTSSRKLVRSIFSRAGASMINRRYRFIKGEKYNVVGTLNGEAAMVAASAPAFVEWLASSGVTMHCHSNSPWLSGIAEPI